MSTEINSNNSDTTLPAPPSYINAVYKVDENDLDCIPPPSYSDVSNQPIIYLNNYPGPPPTDGVVQIDPNLSHYTYRPLSKPIYIYLLVLGIFTVLCGFGAIGIEIGMIIQKSFRYYYGFWSGAVLITLGWNILFFYKRRLTMTYTKLFQSFLGHMLLTLILLIIGLVILIIDKCDDNETDGSQSCQPSYHIFNGFLLGIFAFQLFISVINLLIFGYLKREQI